MKRIPLFLLSFLLLVFSNLLYADDNFEGKQEDSDMDALRKWIREKRMISIKELGGDLSLSGEVRVEYQGINEKKNGERQRGSGSPSNKPENAFDVEVNVMLDYQSDKTWSSIKLEFDNDMGLESGTTHKIALEKAYFGGRLVDGDTFNFDGEMGRRNLSDVFDSKIEFSSIFDGGLLKFNKAFESIGSYYFNLGAFIVNDLYNHFGQVAEMGFLNIANTGFYTKYSFINWKKHYSDDLQNKIFSFGNSQIILGYQGTTSVSKKFYKIYLAGLMNHLAKDLILYDPFKNKNVNFYKRNLAAYVGFSYGRILKADDWALDINFQYVMPQAVSDYDSNGIKRGNAQGVGLYTINVNGTGGATNSDNAVGNANFKGMSIELLYAITGNLTLYQNFLLSNNQTKAFGEKLNYWKYEMEFIYAF